MKMKAKEFFSIPNILSYIRLLLIPVFIMTYLHATTAKGYILSAVVILLSGITDFADGFIARKFNMITQWGKLLDPIADKLTQAAIVICLMSKIKGMWILFTIFIVKELCMGLCYLFLMKKGNKLDGAKWFGKLSTFVFYIATFVIIANPKCTTTVLYTIMIVTAFFLLLSFAMYMRVFYQMRRELKFPQQDKVTK